MLGGFVMAILPKPVLCCCQRKVMDWIWIGRNFGMSSNFLNLFICSIFHLNSYHYKCCILCSLSLGYRLGMCSILALWVAWDCVWGLVKHGNSTIGGRTAFPVFRACGGLLLVHWFWGVSVYVWNRFRINYIL